MSDPAARELLEELVAEGEPLIPYEDGNEVYCHWCDSAKPDDGKPFVHAASCLWLRVRAFLAESEQVEGQAPGQLPISPSAYPPGMETHFLHDGERVLIPMAPPLGAYDAHPFRPGAPHASDGATGGCSVPVYDTEGKAGPCGRPKNSEIHE